MSSIDDYQETLEAINQAHKKGNVTLLAHIALQLLNRLDTTAFLLQTVESATGTKASVVLPSVDYSRDKRGPYAIIAATDLPSSSVFLDGDGFLIVRVMARDDQGNVTKMEQTALSYPRTVEEGQQLLDAWQEMDQSGLVDQAKKAGVLP